MDEGIKQTNYADDDGNANKQRPQVKGNNSKSEQQIWRIERKKLDQAK